MLTGQGQVSSSVSKTTTTVTANGAADGQVKAISQPGGGGSKVEIILHLNQNGMPYVCFFHIIFCVLLTDNFSN